MVSTSQHRRPQVAYRSAARVARVRTLGPLEMLVLAIIAALIIASPFATRQHTNVSGGTRTLQVQSGDNLWSIAQQHPVKGLSTAQTVELIAAGNGLGHGRVSPGQTIVIPSEEQEERLAMR